MNKNHKGFTLVELVVSIALLAIILVPVSGFFTNSFRIQGRTSMKTTITRAGQYLVENLKNKNYSDLANATGTFEKFLTDNVGVEKDSITEKYTWVDEDVKESTVWNFSYNNIDYNVDISFDSFEVSDIANLDIPEKDECDEWIRIDSTGKITKVDWPEHDNVDNEYIVMYEKNPSLKYAHPISGEYPRNYPTIVLKDGYVSNSKDTATLWIQNDYYFEGDPANGISPRQQEIRIVKGFEKELNVFIEGKALSIIKGQAEDRAANAFKRITSSYVGAKVEEQDDGKESSSELLLNAKMTISRKDDDSVRDTLSFSFPIDYDYTEGQNGE